MGFSSASLDRHITGNHGEDSVAPESITARELAYLVAEAPIVVIDAAPQTVDNEIPVTVTEVAITSGFAYVTTKELEYQLIIPEDALVRFAGE